MKKINYKPTMSITEREKIEKELHRARVLFVSASMRNDAQGKADFLRKIIELTQKLKDKEND
jgi:hypothetical protein